MPVVERIRARVTPHAPAAAPAVVQSAPAVSAAGAAPAREAVFRARGLCKVYTMGEVQVHALRDRNPTFVRLHDGAIRNGYTIKIDNRTFAAMPVSVTFEGVPGARLISPGEAPGPALRATVKPNEVLAIRAFVIAPPDGLEKTSLPANFVVTSGQTAARARRR